MKLNKDFWQSLAMCSAAWCVLLAAIWFVRVVFNP